MRLLKRFRCFLLRRRICTLGLFACVRRMTFRFSEFTHSSAKSLLVSSWRYEQLSLKRSDRVVQTILSFEGCGMVDLYYHASNRSQFNYQVYSSNKLTNVFIDYIVIIYSAICESINRALWAGDNDVLKLTYHRPSFNFQAQVVSVKHSKKVSKSTNF